ncbi:MAG: zinc metallopeptidase [Candidatus Caccovivens sp.]
MIFYIVIGIVIAFVLLLCFALAVASFSGENFMEKYKENDKIQISYRISTLEYVGEINRKFFDGKLKVAKCEQFRDHYSSGYVALSQQTMHSNSITSVAIVSHELGHARQDAEGDKLEKHWKLRRAGKICGLFFLPVVLVGITLSLLNIFSVLPQFMYLVLGLGLLGVGFLLFLFSVYLKYREVQIEKEASKYAVTFMQEVLTDDELKLAKEFLDSARLTYWAVLFKTLLGWTFLTKKNG